MSETRNHIKLYTSNMILIKKLKIMLEDQGISAITRDNFKSATMAGFGSPLENTDIHIYEEDKAKALEVLEAFKEEIKE